MGGKGMDKQVPSTLARLGLALLAWTSSANIGAAQSPVWGNDQLRVNRRRAIPSLPRTIRRS